MRAAGDLCFRDVPASPAEDAANAPPSPLGSLWGPGCGASLMDKEDRRSQGKNEEAGVRYREALEAKQDEWAESRLRPLA